MSYARNRYGSNEAAPPGGSDAGTTRGLAPGKQTLTQGLASEPGIESNGPPLPRLNLYGGNIQLRPAAGGSDQAGGDTAAASQDLDEPFRDVAAEPDAADGVETDTDGALSPEGQDSDEAEGSPPLAEEGEEGVEETTTSGAADAAASGTTDAAASGATNAAAASGAHAAASPAVGEGPEDRDRKGRRGAARRSETVPDLPARTVRTVEAHIAAGRNQEAIDVLVRAAARRGRITPRLLTGGRMHYDSSVAGEGVAQPPGYRRDGSARRTRVGIGDAAFTGGVPLLYSSILHEYQHVLQFQQRRSSPSAVPGQGNNAGLIDQQEVEAYSYEILHSRQTGMFQNPAQMEEAWRRLHDEHWAHLSRRQRRPLLRRVRRAHRIAERATGTDLTFNP